jgi:hypothetical protein
MLTLSFSLVNTSGPEGKDWIPDQVRNDRIVKPFLRHYTDPFATPHWSE